MMKIVRPNIKKIEKYLKILTPINSKELLIYVVLCLSQFHVLFYNDNTKIDTFIIDGFTRRIDYYFKYLGQYINNIILVFLIIYPKGIRKPILRFLLALTIFDLLNYFFSSNVLYTGLKILIAFICSVVVPMIINVVRIIINKYLIKDE